MAFRCVSERNPIKKRQNKQARERDNYRNKSVRDRIAYSLRPSLHQQQSPRRRPPAQIPVVLDSYGSLTLVTLPLAANSTKRNLCPVPTTSESLRIHHPQGPSQTPVVVAESFGAG